MEIPNTSRSIVSKDGNLYLSNLNVTVVSIKGVEKKAEDLTEEERNIILNIYSPKKL